MLLHEICSKFIFKQLLLVWISDEILTSLAHWNFSTDGGWERNENKTCPKWTRRSHLSSSPISLSDMTAEDASRLCSQLLKGHLFIRCKVLHNKVQYKVLVFSTNYILSTIFSILVVEKFHLKRNDPKS